MECRSWLFRVLAVSVVTCVGLTSLAGAQTEKKPSVPGPAEEGALSKAKPPMSDEKSAEVKSDKDQPETPARLARATFGGGCFWCLEAVFERIPGVKSVVSGYAGGEHPRPNYELVCTGETGHAEVVQIAYDPVAVTYEQLLDVFWACHDPTTLNRQGPDVGTQYRSVIFYHDDKQKAAALKSYEKLTADNTFGAPIVTQLEPLPKFFPAEKHHQDYYKKHPNVPYCRMMIAPKLKKLGLK